MSVKFYDASGNLLTSNASILDNTAGGTNGEVTKAPTSDVLFDALALKAPLISPAFTTPNIGVASATSLATSAAIPLLLTNGQLVNIALTSQSVGATTLTIPDFASVVDEFTFKTKAQTMANKTLTSPTINGTIATTGLTLPAVTLGGTVTGEGQTVNSLGLVGIGQAASSVSGLAVTFTATDPGAVDTYGLQLTGAVKATTGVYATTFYGVNSRNTIPSDNTQNWTGSPLGLVSFLCRVANLGSTGNVYTITGAAGLRIGDVVNKGSATITTAYGIYIDAITGGATNWGIYNVSTPIHLGLPTADPHVAGQMYEIVATHVVMISAG